MDVDTNGVGSTDDTLTTLSLSADGQYVAFGSPDGSLVSSDNNNTEDVFVRDLVAGTTEMISQRDVTVIPQAPDGFTMMSPSSVSWDGRWMAFTSRADDLVLNDTNQALNVFVRDLVNGTNFLASVGADGGPALGGNSENALISADGRYVVFISAATNLATGPINTNANVFRRDLQTATTVLVSVGTDGVSPGNGDASGLVISPDGRYVAFLSSATNLVAGMTSGQNTYWRDIFLGQTVGLNGYYPAFNPSLSSDGRYVAYAHSVMGSSPTLHIWDTRISMEDIYTNAGAVTSAAIDPTGTKILYRIANTLYVDDIAPASNLFSVPSPATIRNATCWTDDGSCLVFLSNTNLGAGNDGTNRVYLRDFQAGTLSLIGVAGPSAAAWVAVSDAPVISGDGRFVAYRSVATNTTGSTAFANVFLFDRLTGSNTVLATEQAGSGPIVWLSRPVISDDGATIAFLDICGDLVNGDLNRVPDVLGTFLDPALIDSDGDGIPDWWMMKYFGHPTGQAYDNSLASDDADGSGESNLQDYLAGTDPTDPNSVFRILASVPASNSMTLTWFAVPGRTYQVQYTTNLNKPMWLTVTGNVWVTGSQGYYLAPVAQPSSYYRVFKSD
ncbi:MAG: hypothetical protein ACLQUR_01910 [Limisphaerales bacterium]